MGQFQLVGWVQRTRMASFTRPTFQTDQLPENAAVTNRCYRSAVRHQTLPYGLSNVWVTTDFLRDRPEAIF
jgi:hypothetical protein